MQQGWGKEGIYLSSTSEQTKQKYKEKAHVDMAVFVMRKCLHELHLSSKGTVCLNGILKAICCKRDYGEMFSMVSKIKQSSI